MRLDVISIFPRMFDAVTDYGVTGRAVKNGLLTLRAWNPRDFTDDRHRTVDDRPYGGGPGMVLLAEPLARAIGAARAEQATGARVIYLTPQGRRLDHAAVREFAARPGMILLAGRYEGVDERLLETEVDEEWSIGDYVLSGGELAAMVLVDAIARQLPGALGDEDSAAQDSFAQGLLDYEHYTRPEVYAGRGVPEVLLSGDHERIRRWRLKRSLGRTWRRRPDLLAKLDLTDEQRALLEEFKKESETADERG
ncbi:MAG: tRNA (guanosine(37)-N1)-methyltransferase TrmD [Candidatus Muproteobacteria bacterium RIFCSPHIGHO2_02_FULL_65_16]|uniref:tRNA (guanine-N(1)-)-methyltransferase n=1 Tax=Candidatus Muproteobacteria bacterium RIFCSPHIGHO2_02_FULL_65_16 TaxID=1817766 RepID=A0A1F6TXJ2_9PROT|nr:MAG: tRNA (guanosine(37)-N1)-methyltransferase TrmD [Candidatus Muproteobacteria bacterium RIFCSPHIGHO2_02_FULL_65_16]